MSHLRTFATGATFVSVIVGVVLGLANIVHIFVHDWEKASIMTMMLFFGTIMIYFIGALIRIGTEGNYP